MSSSNYSYSSNVPQGPQLISVTQSPIQSNFQAINELLSVNHISFEDPTNYGQHTYTSLILHTDDPSTTSTEMLLYGKQTPGGSNIGELFYRYPSNGTVVQLTGSTASAGATQNGYSYMSDTIVMKWGTVSGIAINSTNIVIFPTSGNIPFTSTPSTVYINPSTPFVLGSASTYVTSVTSTQFSLITGQYAATEYCWMAIGTY